ncbi:MAG: hypothetical protein ACKPFA_26830, partial [Dolichospermum sp.]
RDVPWNVSTLENHTPIQQRQNSLMSLNTKYSTDQRLDLSMSDRTKFCNSLRMEIFTYIKRHETIFTFTDTPY